MTTEASRWSFFAEKRQPPDVILQKTIAFVRQPKFWLACVVAIAVQFILAFVMTPAEGDSDRADHQRTAARPRPKPAPAAQIIVPAAAAPTDALDRSNGPVDGATTPMGLSVPLDSTSDAANAESPLTRMAENRRFAADSRPADGPSAASPDGARLGGIQPIAPTPEPHAPESHTNEQP